ncbi:MAG: preprotein translocase subunit SecE [SAR324 cluster bacterium]|nr:preprotein translocase subunit SecE [SAR324 cluster bacterium]
MFKRIKQFLDDVRSEFKRVQWPTREATLKSTYVVMGLTICVSIFLGASDIGLSELMKLLISN